MIKYLFLYISLLCSCGIFTDIRTITVLLPGEEPPWFSDENNRIGKVVFQGKSEYIENSTIEWDGSFKIRVKKGSSVPIVLYPSGNLKPAGGFFSLNSENGHTVKLEWKDGFLAAILLEVIKKGLPVEHINIRRLSEEIEAKCNGDPWGIDAELLEEALIYNTLSVYKIREKEKIDIILPLDGVWVSDNLFYPPLVSNTKGELVLEKISQGLHKFQNLDTKEQIDILVENEGYEYLVY